MRLRGLRRVADNGVVKRRISVVLVAVGLVLAMAAGGGRDASADKGAVKQGQALFAERGCAHCHGSDGIGGNLGPDLQRVRSRMSAQQIEHQIREGGNGMPPYGDKLEDAQVAELVAFLRAKRKYVTPPKPTEAAPAVAPQP